jgi:hypothetical protein
LVEGKTVEKEIREKKMGDMEIQESKAPVSAERIAMVEEALRIRLPAQYKQFLLEHNGGRPKLCAFNCRDKTGPYSDSVVNWFLAIHDGKYNNFEWFFRTFKVADARLPETLVPIAIDPGGNLICISVSGPDEGAVYFWDHELEPSPADRSTVGYPNVHLIADSFDEFLVNLRPSPYRK